MVYAAVRSTLLQAGLDASRAGTSDWNPLGKWIRPGQRVFVLCNFVYHRRRGETDEVFWSKCTHGSVLRALVDYLLIATGPTGKISFGNAPLQSCHWPDVLEATGAQQVEEFYQKQGLSVVSRDLRMLVREQTFAGTNSAMDERSEVEHCLRVDLSKESWLNPLASSSEPTRFRVTDYDYRRTEAFQSDGQHVYVINREILDSDVIVSLPKLKTHEKVGITCSLKGFVGIVGHKDCLAHHRFGGPNKGGDEYPYHSRLLRMFSKMHEFFYSTNSARPSSPMVFLDRNLRRVLRILGLIGAGAWHGNDTAWRMTLDLARIATYADRNGSMQQACQRKHLIMIDGIIAGEGQGPLSPSPASSGALIFSDSAVLADWAACKLMGFDPNQIPLLKFSTAAQSFPLFIGNPLEEELVRNEQKITLSRLAPALHRNFVAPAGWEAHLNSQKKSVLEEASPGAE